MRRSAWLVWMGIVIGAGCSSSGKSAETGTTESLSSALTHHVKFEAALVKKGDLPKADAQGEKATLVEDSSVLTLGPGLASIMALDVDNPDEAKNAVVATLMQFDGSDSRIEVPRKDGASEDGGTGQSGVLHMENPFSVDDEICKYLCNRRYMTSMTLTVTLANGGVCKHEARDVELDCSERGDPKQCSASDKGSQSDAGARDAGARATGGKGGSGGSGGNGASGGTGGSSTGGSGGTGGSGTGGSGGSVSMRDEDAGSAEPAPQLASITPTSATAGDAVSLTISGTGFLSGAVIYVDDSVLTTKFVNETTLSATLPVSATSASGNLAIYVENVSGDARTSSNILYLRIDPAPGAPVVYDYSPDNGVPGDKIIIIASNLANQTLTLTDAKGHELTPGTISTLSWPTAGTADTVEITLPDNIATGPITVGNPLGSFKGKIFTVGQNLTRASGTTLSSSTQYNDTNWARASGGDNLLSTSFFTAHGDCATETSCTTKPFFKITFASAQTVARIAMRGNREYASGYDFLNGKFELLDASDHTLWGGTYDLPEPDRDLDLVLPTPVANVVSVMFSGLSDESDEPGFSELEVF